MTSTILYNINFHLSGGNVGLGGPMGNMSGPGAGMTANSMGSNQGMGPNSGMSSSGGLGSTSGMGPAGGMSGNGGIVPNSSMGSNGLGSSGMGGMPGNMGGVHPGMQHIGGMSHQTDSYSLSQTQTINFTQQSLRRAGGPGEIFFIFVLFSF